LSLGLTKHHAMKTQWGSGDIISRILNLGPGRFTRGTHWVEAWIGPRAGLNAEAKRKNNPIIAPAGNLI